MSRENVEVLRRLYAVLTGLQSSQDAFRDGDVDVFLDEFWDDGVVCDGMPGTPIALDSPVLGREGVKRLMEGQMEVLDYLRIEPEEFVDRGDSVVVPIRLYARARHTGLEGMQTTVHLWRMRDGKAIQLTVYPTKADALEAVGLREQA
jgi:ketosteroid isomerase-like protein